MENTYKIRWEGCVLEIQAIKAEKVGCEKLNIF